MTDKLKPCPFCGDKLQHLGGGRYYAHQINGCILQHQCFEADDKEVIEAWNTRKPMYRIVEQLEEEAKRWYESGKEFKDEKELGVAGGFRYAIEIVKGVQNE